MALPSKRVGFFAPSSGALIARSDSNGEDLEAFAGAGDSYYMQPLPSQYHFLSGCAKGSSSVFSPSLCRRLCSDYPPRWQSGPGKGSWLLQAGLNGTLALHAGLYDSVPVPNLEERTLDYAGSALFWEPEALQSMLQGIAAVGRSVEAAFGGAPQDIEGVVVDGRVTVVQSRAEVL